MSSRNGYWVDLRDDDESDGGDPFEAGERLLKSLSPRAREALVNAGLGATCPSGPDPSVSELRVDGPRARFIFSWRGTDCDFSNATCRYKLVEALWDYTALRPRAERDLDEVLDAVYGENTVGDLEIEKLRAERLKNLCFHVRKAFRDKGIALDVRRRGGKVWLEELPA